MNQLTSQISNYFLLFTKKVVVTQTLKQSQTLYLMYLHIVLWSLQQRQMFWTNNQAELKSGSANSTSFARLEEKVSGRIHGYTLFCSAKIHLFPLQQPLCLLTKRHSHRGLVLRHLQRQVFTFWQKHASASPTNSHDSRLSFKAFRWYSLTSVFHPRKSTPCGFRAEHCYDSPNPSCSKPWHTCSPGAPQSSSEMKHQIRRLVFL